VFDGGKPNSVVDDHLSKRHTRGSCRTGCPSSVLSCTAWGFSCRANCSARGELLPRLFTLADSNGKQVASPTVFCQRTGGVFSVTLSVSAIFQLRRPRILRGMLPYGVRTFLQRTSAVHQRSSAIDRILAYSGLAAFAGHQRQTIRSRPILAGGIRLAVKNHVRCDSAVFRR